MVSVEAQEVMVASELNLLDEENFDTWLWGRKEKGMCLGCFPAAQIQFTAGMLGWASEEIYHSLAFYLWKVKKETKQRQKSLHNWYLA